MMVVMGLSVVVRRGGRRVGDGRTRWVARPFESRVSDVLKVCCWKRVLTSGCVVGCGGTRL